MKDTGSQIEEAQRLPNSEDLYVHNDPKNMKDQEMIQSGEKRKMKYGGIPTVGKLSVGNSKH